MKGHTKIELFNARTGKLEKTVEDNNMFTNALNSLLNDNIGGDLSDPADIFPLPEKALGGLMLLPEAEEENVNNLFPHSFPTATGVYGRTDISDNSMMGVYNAEKSGYSPNKESYTHVWEFPTYQGNGTIACAALTHKYATDYITNADGISGRVASYSITSALATSKRNPQIYFPDYPSSYLATSSITVAGQSNGYIYWLDWIDMSISDEIPPRFQLYRSKIIDKKIGKIDYEPIKTCNSSLNFSNDFEPFATVTLPFTYGQYLAYQPLPYEEGKFLLLVTSGVPTLYRTGYYDVTNYPILPDAFVDTYIVDIETQNVQFLRTLNMPTYDPSTGNIEIIDSGRVTRNTLEHKGAWPDTYFSGTDLHLCLQPSFGMTSNNVTDYYYKRQIFSNYSGCMYYNGYLIYHPITFNDGNRIRRNSLIIMNIFTNEFWTTDVEDDIYQTKQMFPNRGIFIFNDIVVDIDNNRTLTQSGYEGIQTTIASNSRMNTNGTNVYSLNSCGIYDTKIYTTSVDGASASGGNSQSPGRSICPTYILRSRNNMYLATINNLPQPITKSSEQTMRVTYTISNGV